MRKFGLLLALSLCVFNGCAVICRPKYSPTQVLPCVVTDNRAVHLRVTDSRSSEERYFALNGFVKFYEPYVREHGQSPLFTLERPAAEIFTESVKMASLGAVRHRVPSKGRCVLKERKSSTMNIPINRSYTLSLVSFYPYFRAQVIGDSDQNNFD